MSHADSNTVALGWRIGPWIGRRTPQAFVWRNTGICRAGLGSARTSIRTVTACTSTRTMRKARRCSCAATAASSTPGISAPRSSAPSTGAWRCSSSRATRHIRAASREHPRQSAHAGTRDRRASGQWAGLHLSRGRTATTVEAHHRRRRLRVRVSRARPTAPLVQRHAASGADRQVERQRTGRSGSGARQNAESEPGRGSGAVQPRRRAGAETGIQAAKYEPADVCRCRVRCRRHLGGVVGPLR